MKKLLVVVLTLLVGISAISAQHFVIGGRLGALYGFHALELELDVNYNSKINFNFAGYMAYALNDRFSIQGELNFMLNQGIEVQIYSSLTYSSLDIPVLFKYAFIDSPALIGFQAGPHLSIPISKVKIFTKNYEPDELIEMDTDGTAIGLTAGLFAGSPVGPGFFVVDIRLLFDITAQKIKIEDYGTENMIKRRGIAMTIGYELLF